MELQLDYLIFGVLYGNNAHVMEAWLVHAGILLIALGITGMGTLASSLEGTMLPREKMPLMGYAVEFVGVSET